MVIKVKNLHDYNFLLKMENIDDLMRQKFDSDDPAERIPFSEEYWEQARLLLEKEEKRRRHKAWWWWLALALLVCAVVGLCRGFFSSKGKGIFGTTGADAHLMSSPAIHPAATADTFLIQSNTVNPTVEPPVSTPALPGTESVADIGSRPVLSNNQTMKKPAAATRLRPQNPQNKEALPSSARGGQILNTSSPTPIGAADSSANTDSKNKNTLLNQSDVAKNNAQTPASSPIISSSNPPVPSAGDSSSFRPFAEETPSFVPSLLSNGQLPVGLTPLPVPTRSLPVKTVVQAPIADRIQPVRDRRFQWHLALSGTVSQADTSGKWIGYSAGTHAGYRIGKDLTLSLGLKWRFVPGQEAPPNEASDTMPLMVERLRYSFGFHHERWARKTVGVHYFEVPLALHWQRKQWGFLAGAAGQWLLTDQQTIRYTVSSSLVPEKTTISRFVSGDKSRYTAFGMAAFIGADYALSRRISIGANIQYRFTPLFRFTAPGVSRQGLGNFDLGIKYRLY